MIKNNFVIISQQRTGSSDLVHRLKQYQEIECLGEIFHKLNTNLPNTKFNGMKFSIENRQNDPILFLDEVSKNITKEFFGFKFFLYQNTRIKKYFLDESPAKYIFLTRKNKLAQFASFETAVISNKWHATKESKLKVSQKPTFKPHKFEEYLEQHKDFEEFQRLIEEKNKPSISIYYEELNGIKTYERLISFLNYDHKDKNEFFPSIYRKMSNGAVTDRFNNPEEVKKYLDSKNLSELEYE